VYTSNPAPGGGVATCQPLPGSGHDYGACPFTPEFRQRVLALDAKQTAADFALLCQCNTGITAPSWAAVVSPTGGMVTGTLKALAEVGPGGITSIVVLTVVQSNGRLLVNDITWNGKPLVAF
jgi:hypothetical protein